MSDERQPGDDRPEFEGTGDLQHEPSTLAGELVPMDTTALSAVVRTEVDAGLAWADKHPRSIATFRNEMDEFALRDKETAEKMYYALRRGGKTLVGPSVRLAELAAECYGNLKAGARLISTSGEYAIAEGVAQDLERNVWIARTVARRLLDREGRRYSDDMVVVTANAAGSLALRNAIVSVIGRRYLDPVVDRARVLVGGGLEGVAQRRKAAAEWWAKAGVTLPRLLATLNRSGLEDVTTEDLADLHGIARAIKDGETTVDDAFAPAETLVDKVRRRHSGGEEAAPAARGTVIAQGDVTWKDLPPEMRAIAEGWVREMEEGSPTMTPRLRKAMKEVGFDFPLESARLSTLSSIYAKWKALA